MASRCIAVYNRTDSDVQACAASIIVRRDIEYEACVTTREDTLVKARRVLITTGSVLIIVSIADCIAGVATLLCSSLQDASRNDAFGCFLFGLVNGALVLRAAANKPYVDAHWATVNLAFGVATLVVHYFLLADTITFELQVRRAGSRHANRLNFRSYTLAAIESLRLFAQTALLAFEIWQVTVAVKLLRYFHDARERGSLRPVSPSCESRERPREPVQVGVLMQAAEHAAHYKPARCSTELRASN